MPYDPNQDVTRGTGPNESTLGSSGRPVTTSDTVDMAPYAKALVVLAAGTVKIIPSKNADGAPLAFTDSLPAGTIIPYRVRRVFATGTTATLATIDG